MLKSQKYKQTLVCDFPFCQQKRRAKPPLALEISFYNISHRFTTDDRMDNSMVEKNKPDTRPG